MKDDRLEELLYEIVSDTRIIRVEPFDYIVRSLSPSEVVYSNFVYKTELEKAKQAGILFEAECLEQAIKFDLWNKDKDQLIRLYYAEIKDLEKTKELYKFNKGKRIKLDNDIKKVKIKLKPLEDERYQITHCSAEGIAMSKKIGYVISRCILYMDGTQKWHTYEDFLDYDDIKHVNEISVEFGKLTPRNESEIRALARFPTWNVMWSSSKKSGHIFDRPSSQYSKDQLLLCYWSMMYDSVYESMERPSDKVIADDEALDKWFEEQSNKRKRDSKAKDIIGRGGANKHGEVFVMAKGDEDADDIYSLNDKMTLAQMRAESQRLEEKQGQLISEWQLRKGKIKREHLMKASAKQVAAQRKEAMRPRRFIGGK